MSNDLLLAIRYVRDGNAELFEGVLKKGLDPRLKCKDEKSLFSILMFETDNQELRDIYYHYDAIYGIDKRIACAIDSLRAGHFSEFENLINSGLDPNSKDRNGRSLLIHAIWNKNTEAVKLLLLSGADVNTTDKDNLQKPIIAAGRTGTGEIIDLLLSYGVDVNTTEGVNGGFNALSQAASLGNKCVVQCLINRGIDIKRFGCTALSSAAFNGDVDTVDLLFKNGIDLNTGYTNNTTPLMTAVSRKKIDLINYLLYTGADPNVRNKFGLKAIDYAIDDHNFEIIEILKEKSQIDEKELKELIKLHNLPKEVRNYLESGDSKFVCNSPEYEETEVELNNIQELRFINLRIGPFNNIDPNYGKDGYYLIPAVNLIKSAKNHSAIGILVWMKDINSFGCYDNDHELIHVFKDIKWKDIVNNPCIYINAQWNPKKEYGIIPLIEYCKPWDKWAFNEC